MHPPCTCHGPPIVGRGEMEFLQCDNPAIVPTDPRNRAITPERYPTTAPISPQSDGESQRGQQAENSTRELSELTGESSVVNIVHVYNLQCLSRAHV